MTSLTADNNVTTDATNNNKCLNKNIMSCATCVSFENAAKNKLLAGSPYACSFQIVESTSYKE